MTEKEGKPGSSFVVHCLPEVEPVSETDCGNGVQPHTHESLHLSLRDHD